MIQLEPADNPERLRAFRALPHEIYRSMPQHRSTDEEIVTMLASRKSAFFEHARLEPFIAEEGGRVVARFALCHDRKRPEYVQIALFESLPGVEGLLDAVLSLARERFDGGRRVVSGLSGHLNYSAGFLASHFDLPPVFGLPHTPAYYLDYFAGLERKEMVSFRFETRPFYTRWQRRRRRPGTITFRTLDMRKLEKEVEIYTGLNNACFAQHPYWADRTPIEDLELFQPFRFFIDETNLLFAERDGQPVGFLLWYPDFNELARNGEPLGLRHLLRYRVLSKLGGRRIRTLRLTEIAVLPELRKGSVVAGLFAKLAEVTIGRSFEYCEGGFIFAQNRDCISMTQTALRHGLGRELPPYRSYCVFEGPL